MQPDNNSDDNKVTDQDAQKNSPEYKALDAYFNALLDALNKGKTYDEIIRIDPTQFGVDKLISIGAKQTIIQTVLYATFPLNATINNLKAFPSLRQQASTIGAPLSAMLDVFVLAIDDIDELHKVIGENGESNLDKIRRLLWYGDKQLAREITKEKPTDDQAKDLQPLENIGKVIKELTADNIVKIIKTGTPRQQSLLYIEHYGRLQFFGESELLTAEQAVILNDKLHTAARHKTFAKLYLFDEGIKKLLNLFRIQSALTASKYWEFAESVAWYVSAESAEQSTNIILHLLAKNPNKRKILSKAVSNSTYFPYCNNQIDDEGYLFINPAANPTYPLTQKLKDTAGELRQAISGLKAYVQGLREIMQKHKFPINAYYDFIDKTLTESRPYPDYYVGKFCINMQNIKNCERISPLFKDLNVFPSYESVPTDTATYESITKFMENYL